MTRIVEARQRIGRFTSVEQFHRTTGVTKSTVRLLAEADAFTSLDLSRRQALWRAMSLDDRQLPLFDEAASPPLRASMPSCLRAFPSDDSHLSLPPMPLGQEVMTDYRTTALSLKRHPVSLVRPELTAKGIITTAEMNAKDHGKWASVAGLVLIRQRPGTASGIVFETIEDETGVVNLIVRPNIYDRFRPAARHATLLHAQGYVERQGQVVHLMVFRMADLSDMLAGYRFASRDFH